MARVNVFLKDELLKAVDDEAAETRVNRSALIQSALIRFLQARRREREEAAIRQEMEAAGRGMDALAEKLGDWDPVTAIRDDRERRSRRIGEPRTRYRGATRKRRP